MSKKWIMLFIFVLSLILSSCNYIGQSFGFTSIAENIKPPEMQELSIKGTWEVDEMFPLTNVDPIILEKYNVNDKLYIDENHVSFLDRYTVNPRFKSRYVNANSFVTSKYNGPVDGIEFEDEYVILYSISDGQRFYQDILIYDEDTILFSYDSILFKLDKVSESIPDYTKYRYEDELLNPSTNVIDVPISGRDTALLLGIRSSKVDEEENAYYDYSTIMIRRSSDKKPMVYKTKDLFLPRTTGFWHVGSKHLGEESPVKDHIFTHPVAESYSEQYLKKLDGINQSIITFLGNKYISLESYNDRDIKTYSVFDLDAFEEQKKLSIESIAGEEGLEIFKTESIRAIEESSEISPDDAVTAPQNIGIQRFEGRWRFRSNVMIKSNDIDMIKDYSISIVPIIEIFSGNQLFIPWKDIKTKHQGAIDAFISPLEDLIVIQNVNELLIYQIKNGIIDDLPLTQIHVAETDRVVMIEWATGKMAGSWQDEFSKQPVIPVEYRHQ